MVCLGPPTLSALKVLHLRKPVVTTGNPWSPSVEKPPLALPRTMLEFPLLTPLCVHTPCPRDPGWHLSLLSRGVNGHPWAQEIASSPQIISGTFSPFKKCCEHCHWDNPRVGETEAQRNDIILQGSVWAKSPARVEPTWCPVRFARFLMRCVTTKAGPGRTHTFATFATSGLAWVSCWA